MKHFKQFFVFALLALFSVSAWGATATYTVASTSTVDVAGAPTDATVSYSSTYSSKEQLTAGNSMTLTLSGYTGYKITAITLSMKSNSSKGAGSFSAVAGSTTIASISDAKFNDASWNGAWSTSYVNITPTMSDDDYEIQSGEDVVLTISASANSLYCNSFTIAYEEVGGSSDVIVKTLKSIAVAGMTTSYDQGDVFSFDGTCTATYSVTKNDVPQADENKIVTPTSVTSPDMTTTGDKTITVTYTEDAVTKTTTYDITVNTHVITPGEYGVLLDNVLWGVTSGQQAAGVTSLSGRANDIDFTMTKGGSQMYASATQTRFYSGATLTISAPTGFVITSIVFAEPTTDKRWDGSITADEDAYDEDLKTWAGSAQSVQFSFGAQNRIATATVTFEAEAADAPSVTISPVAVDATAAAVADGLIDATYENIDLASVAVGLYNDAECNETFTDGWLTASLNGDKDIAYSISANNAFEARTAYIKLTAPASNGTSSDVVKVIAVNQAAKEYVFASLAELLENVTPTTTAKNVTVTLTDEVIVGFAKSGSYTNGVKFNVTYGSPSTTKEIEIYFYDVPSEWQIGGKISGTLTNCPWKTFSGTWELAPASGWAWSNLTYTAPKAVSSVVVTGAPTKTTYVDGEKFDPAGLTVTVNYNDATHEVVDASMATWAYNPSQVLAKDQTSVGVQATYNEVQSVEYSVSGLTVGEIPTKTVAEFIAAEGMRCYLVGTVSDIETGTKLKYGNFNLTDASGTIYVYGCLDTEGNAEQFGSLDVEDGDKIKVIAETYKYYGSKDEAVNVQFVQEINVAKITIDNMSMEFGDVATINATITPAAAANAVTYAIKAGSDDCITLEGDQVTAKPVAGTATIVATISDAPEYDGAVKEFTITVTAPDSRKTAVIDGITAVSGTLVTETAGTHKDKEYISYAALKGNAANAPVIPSGKSFVRIYQNGGYLAINAVKGCLIDEVIVSIPSDCNPTTIAVGTDEENLPTTGGSSATAGNNFSTGTGLNSPNVYLVCLGTDKNHRLEVGAITVKYNGDPISVKSIALSGEYQTEFTKNATFNHDGVIVTATYTDDSQADVTTLAEFSDPDMSTIGPKEITVSYGDKSTSYNIEVVAATLTEIALSGTYPTRFNMGDEFSHTGMTVTATYSDYSEEDVTASALFSGYDMSVAGAQTVTVEYGGQSAEYQIIVVPENTDVLTADLIGVEGTSYADWSDKTGFGTSSVYAGNSTNGSGANAGAIQLRYNASEEAKQAGIILTGSNGMVLKGFSVTVKSGSNTLNVYGKNTAYTSRLDLYSEDEATRGKLIGTVSATGALTLEEGVSYDDNYQYIGMRSNSGALYFSCIMITWGDASITPTKDVIRDGLTAGKWGTICPKQTVEEVEGATFYQIAYLEEQNNLPYNVVFDQIEGTTLTAGQPYFFIAEGEEIKGIKTGAELDAADPAGVNGFYGYIGTSSLALSNIHAEYTPGADNTFVIHNNSVFRINSATNLKSERCYININATEPTRTPSSASPVRRRIVMGVQNTNAATGMDELNASEAPRKMIIDGKMYIFRGEKMYNANGQLVK